MTEPSDTNKPEKNELTRLLYSVADFQMALSAAEFLSECDPNSKYQREQLRRFRCYETTMVVSYCRPFSKSFSEVPSFSFNMIEIAMSDNERLIHERLCHYRNKVFAHSDSEMMRMKSVTFPIEGKNLPLNFLDLRFDEGLHFLPDIDETIAWLRRIIEAIVKYTFPLVQDNPGEFCLVLDPEVKS